MEDEEGNEEDKKSVLSFFSLSSEELDLNQNHDQNCSSQQLRDRLDNDEPRLFDDI